MSCSRKKQVGKEVFLLKKFLMKKLESLSYERKQNHINNNDECFLLGMFFVLLNLGI